MTEAVRQAGMVRCVLLPLQEMRLLLPNAAVVEVIDYRPPDAAADDEPEWLLGTVSWRQQAIPLLSFERLLGRDVHIGGHRLRIAVCHTLSDESGRGFMGIVTQGIPRLMQAREDNIVPVALADEEADWPVVSAVQLQGEDALIPDIDRLRALLSPAG